MTQVVENDEPDVGDRVVDRDDDDPTQAVIVNRPPRTADEWEVPGTDHTVATFPGNEEYPDDDPIAVVCFESDLEAHHAEWDGDYPLSLADVDAKIYTFPLSRLELAEEDEGGDPLEAIAEELEESVDDVDLDADEEVVRVTKLGKTFTVGRDGDVLEDGPIARRVEERAREVVR